MEVIKVKDPVRVYIVEGSFAFNDEYKDWIKNDPEMVLVDRPADCEALLFTGGADICPSIYGQPVHPKTKPHLSRDSYEVSMFLMGRDKLKIGICRGAQLLNALSGGSTFQHVQGHLDPHGIKLLVEGGAIIRDVPSTHHQMMIPSPIRADRTILGVAVNDKGVRLTTNVSHKELPPLMMRERWNFFTKYIAEDYNPREDDAEIIFYHNTDSLCIQSHPEKRACPGPFRAYCNALIVNRAKNRRSRIESQQVNPITNGEIICVDT